MKVDLFSEDSFDPEDLKETEEANMAHQFFFENDLGCASRSNFCRAKKTGTRIMFDWGSLAAPLFLKSMRTFFKSGQTI